MKTMVALAGLLAGLSTGARAQSAPPLKPQYPSAVVARASAFTRELSQRLYLNEGQYVQVKDLHMRMQLQRRELEQRLAQAPAEERDAELAAAQVCYENALNNLLAPNQLMAFRALRTNFTAQLLH